MLPVVRRCAAVGAGVLVVVASAVTGGVGGGVAASAQATAPNDPGYSRQWGLARIGAPAAWAAGYRGEGITIAIVDSGVDPDHPDLAGQLVGSADCVDHACEEGGGGDDAGHGTHVAGIAAAETGNGIGVAGVAPDAHLLSVKVLSNHCDPDCQASGTEGDVADGIRWAADHGADVINLSLGSVTQAVLGPGQAFTDALQYAWSAGAIPVLVAGNQFLAAGSLVDVPAVVVAATTRDDGRASYSSGVGNVRWAVAAPGGEADDADSCQSALPNGVLSTYFRPDVAAADQATYACVAGTSMAAPHVSGALADLLSGGLTPEDAIDRLLATAVDLGPPGRDDGFGDGRIDLSAAVAGLPVVTPADDGPGVDGGPDVTTSTVAAPLPATATTSTNTTVAITPTTAAPAPTATGPDGDAAPAAPADPTLDDGAGDGAAAGPSTGPTRGPADDDHLPALPLSLAVAAVLVTAGAHGWRYLGAASWARRTPPD